ncbi:MAG: acyltransferase [Syntrophomonadaceae bacterium]
MQKHRLDEIDILRGLTFLAIAMQHSLAVFIYAPDLDSVSAWISAFLLILIRYAVPMFITITGLVLVYNHGQGGLDYPQFLRKRFAQAFIPYFAWTIIYYFWSSGGTFPVHLSAAPVAIARLTLSGEACYHLWFMVAIFQFYLLFPFFRWLILKNKDQPIFFLTASFVTYIGLMWLWRQPLPQMANLQTPWLITLWNYRDRVFLSWFFYFILGGFAGLYVGQLRQITKDIQKTNVFVYVMAFLFVFYQVVTTGRTGPTGIYQLNFNYTLPLTPVMAFFITSALLTVLYRAQTAFLRYQPLRRVLKLYGRYSYGCYFVHAMALYYITIIAGRYLKGTPILLQLALTFAACSLLSLGLVFMVNRLKIPGRQFLIGKVPPEKD